MNVRILKKNVDISNYNCEITCEWILDERTRGAKRELENLAYKEILLWFKKSIPDMSGQHMQHGLGHGNVGTER